MFYPYVHKRKSFAHEQELRAIMQDYSPLRDAAPEGIQRAVDISSLVEAIYVAPTGMAWFKELVEETVRRFELDIPVHQSALDAEPFF